MSMWDDLCECLVRHLSSQMDAVSEAVDGVGSGTGDAGLLGIETPNSEQEGMSMTTFALVIMLVLVLVALFGGRKKQEEAPVSKPARRGGGGGDGDRKDDGERKHGGGEVS